MYTKWKPSWRKPGDITIFTDKWYLEVRDNKSDPVIIRRGGNCLTDSFRYAAEITDDVKLYFHGVHEMPPQNEFILVYSEVLDRYLYTDEYNFESMGEVGDYFASYSHLSITGWTTVDISFPGGLSAASEEEISIENFNALLLGDDL